MVLKKKKINSFFENLHSNSRNHDRVTSDNPQILLRACRDYFLYSEESVDLLMYEKLAN